MMQKVLWSLLPVALFAVWNFGWRAIALVALSNAVGYLVEWIFCRFAFKSKVSEAVFVTGTLFALTLPPTIPFWIAALGIAFGVAFGKMVFGGFGRNLFNPALVGRAFIYVSFAVLMNNIWSPSLLADGWGFPSGFAVWLPDAVTSATPLRLMKTGTDIPVLPLLLGNIPGSLGETSALLIIASGVYLCVTKTASWKIMVSTILSMVLFQFLFWKAGWTGSVDPLRALFSGGFLFAAVFMATDPVSASQTGPGRWIYGILIGALSSVIRTWSSWAEGAMFAVLLGNTFAPIVDYTVKAIAERKTPKAAD
jgi:Na+-transporting NADH:ubiquinone oxidoreductase subunit B